MFGSHYRRMQRVCPDRPCPVCGKPDWCLVAPDGSAAICPRTEAGALKQIGESGWLHILDDRTAEREFVPPAPRKRATPDPKPRRFQEMLNVVVPPTADILSQFARSLGVTPRSLARLEVRRASDGSWWFPERDETGRTIGIQRRFPDGTKKRWFGGAAGLTYANDWDTGVGPLLLPEGASDTAAVMSLGLSAIGRPSNMGGCALLGAILQAFERPIIVVGEYDQREKGAWPGRDGAIRTATELAKRLSRPVHWALPPDRAKDARQWLIEYGGDEPVILGSCFLEGMLLETVTPPALVKVERRKGPEIDLDAYRRALVKARLLSLDRPAVYLDRSPTGTGKSFADRAALKSILTQGGGA